MYLCFPSKAHLSEQQLETLRSYRRSQMEKKQAELQDRYRRALENAEDREGSCPKRDVTPVWRLCIADSLDQPGTGESLIYCRFVVVALMHVLLCIQILTLNCFSLPVEPLATPVRSPVFTEGGLSIQSL